MAKFNKGDLVRYAGGKTPRGKIDERTFQIDRVYPSGAYSMVVEGTRFPYAMSYKAYDADLVAANSLVSTNAVVANALAARTACNSFYKPKVGEEIRYRWMGRDTNIRSGKIERASGDDFYVRNEDGALDKVKYADISDVERGGRFQPIDWLNSSNALAARGAVANALRDVPYGDFMAHQVDQFKKTVLSSVSDESARHEIGYIDNCLKNKDATNETKQAAGICKRKIEEIASAVRRAVDSVKVNF